MHPATKFISTLFEPNDLLAFMFLYPSGEVKHVFASATEACTSSFIARLRATNKNANVYVAMNTFKSRGTRTEANVDKVRHLWLDLDKDGIGSLGALNTSAKVPEPTVILESSPGKYQVVWNIEDGLFIPEAKSLLKGLAIEFGGDINATDCARVLRVPGFKNLKYEGRPEVLVEVEQEVPKKYDRSEFKIEITPSKAEERKADVSREDVIEGDRNNALARYAGKLRNDGLDQEEILVVLSRVNAERCSPPLPDQELETISRSIGKKPSGELPLAPTVLIGGREPGSAPVVSRPTEEQTELQKLIDDTPDQLVFFQESVDSTYPEWVWSDTFYSDFARYCGRSNMVPHEFFIEALKTINGAIFGHRFQNQEGRFYTVLLSARGGIGKGTSFSAAQELFMGTGLLYSMIGSSAFLQVGCAHAAFASSPGMYTNGFSQKPRILQIYDEATALLEKFSIPNSGDSFLDDLNTLYERNGYSPKLTKANKTATLDVSDLHCSILAGTTFDKWVSVFGKSSVDGSGFFQRLNLISSDETHTVASIERLDFTEGEGRVLRDRIVRLASVLEFQTVRFTRTPEADKRFNEWWTQFQEEHRDEHGDTIGRLNVLAERNFEHLAISSNALDLKPNPHTNGQPITVIVDLDTVNKAIALSEYQFEKRIKHRPAVGANDYALVEDLVRQFLNAAPNKMMSRRDLYRHCRKYGLGIFGRVLDQMVGEGLIEQHDKTKPTTKGRRGHVVVWIGGDR